MSKTLAQINVDLNTQLSPGGKRLDESPSVSEFTLLRDVIQCLNSDDKVVLNSLKIGDDTNYSEFDSSGVLTMFGNARVYKQKWVPFNALKAPGTKPATFKEWGISGVWEFSDATDDTIVCDIPIPLDMDRTTIPVIRLGWSTNTAVITETSVWQLEYLYRALGEDTTAAAQDTLTVNSNADAQANGFNIAAFPGADLIDDDDICMKCRIKRLGADPADDLTDTAELHGVCFMYISNKLGEPL